MEIRPLEWSFEKYALQSSSAHHWRQSPIKAKWVQQQCLSFHLILRKSLSFFQNICPVDSRTAWGSGCMCASCSEQLRVMTSLGCRGEGNWKKRLFGIKTEPSHINCIAKHSFLWEMLHGGFTVQFYTIFFPFIYTTDRAANVHAIFQIQQNKLLDLSIFTRWKRVYDFIVRLPNCITYYI